MEQEDQEFKAAVALCIRGRPRAHETVLQVGAGGGDLKTQGRL